MWEILHLNRVLILALGIMYFKSYLFTIFSSLISSVLITEFSIYYLKWMFIFPMFWYHLKINIQRCNNNANVYLLKPKISSFPLSWAKETSSNCLYSINDFMKVPHHSTLLLCVYICMFLHSAVVDWIRRMRQGM